MGGNGQPTKYCARQYQYVRETALTSCGNAIPYHLQSNNTTDGITVLYAHRKETKTRKKKEKDEDGYNNDTERRKKEKEEKEKRSKHALRAQAESRGQDYCLLVRSVQ